MMKRTLMMLFAILLIACSTKKIDQTDGKEFKKHPQWSENATMYELNVRQFTPQGTFEAAQKQLPRLKELGVDVLWVMPIQKIGNLNRKGGLGSYYAIQDYCEVNPEFGTQQDFKNFVDQAHKLGIKVILDWVANHTAPDHGWTKNEGWHLKDSLGNLVVRYDWTDIAELNYDNQNMRKEMINSMIWWLDKFGVDGFRCDVAMEVPTEFWEEAIVKLKEKNEDIFMLAEAEVPEHTKKAFDIYYGWDLHHILNAVAQQKIDVDSMWRYFEKADTIFPNGAMRLNFTSNHDENSWNGTEYERMGDAVEAMAAMTFVVPGMPLIYTGQEVALNKRLRFFDKDTVNFQNAQNHKMTKLYQNLDKLRDQVEAIYGQPKGAKIIKINNDKPKKVFSFIRENQNSALVGMFNLSADTLIVEFEDKLIGGEWRDFRSGEKVDIKTVDVKMLPWDYVILYR